MLIPLIMAWLVAQPALKNPIETAHLSIATSASAESVARGAKIILQLDVTPKPKMHVYAPGQEGYIAIQLTLAGETITPAKAKYPSGEKYVMPALNETQLVYAKPFRITDEVTLKPSARGTVVINGTVRYQACDDAICYLPKTVPVEWRVNVK